MQVKKINSLVSIITITRNRAHLIGRCIESIQKQTYTYYEHIIIDSSTDDSTKYVIETYSDKKIVYIQLKEYLSIPQTIWLAFEKSSGAFITFLDDDDEYLPLKIQKQISLIEDLPEDFGMVYCWMSYFDDVTKQYLKTHSATLRGYVANEVVETPIVSGTPTFFIKRHVFHEIGGWKNENEIGVISDWELGARICQKWKVDFVAESLVNIYINHGSVRMSDKGYYKNTSEKFVTFHKYFLSHFFDIFERYPAKSVQHLYGLSSNLMRLGRWKEAKKYYYLLLKLNPTIKNYLLPIYCFFKQVKNGN